jgi:hypothetical protein
MDLTSYVDNLRRELATAAEAGGDEARALAERLTSVLESATRLSLLEALSAAADEITRDLAPGSVEVRLRGRDPEFVVTPPVTSSSPPEPSLKSALVGAFEVSMGVRPPAESGEPDDAGGTTRVTLRLPEHLKPRIDEAAARAGLSVNAWLVRAVSAALEPGTPPRPDGRTIGRNYTGWVR